MNSKLEMITYKQAVSKIRLNKPLDEKEVMKGQVNNQQNKHSTR